MPIASNLSFLGIAKEAVPGTPVAATAFLPVTSMAPAIKQIYLPDEAFRASQAKTFAEIAGPQYVEYGYDGPAFADAIGWALVGVLGDVATTGAGAPFTHTAALKNDGQPATYTLSDYNGFNTRQFAGCKFSELGLKFAGNGTLDTSIKAVGRAGATSTKPTPSWSSVVMTPAWLGAVTIGVASSSLIVSGDLTIKRTVEPILNVDGQAGPYDVFAGGDLECTGSFVAVYEDDTLYANYTAGTTTALDFNWLTGAGAALTQIKLHMSSVQIDDAQINRGSGKYVELACKFTANATAADAGGTGGFAPIKATLQNALPTGTYK